MVMVFPFFSCSLGCLEFPASLAAKCDHVTKFLTERCKQKWCMATSGNFPWKTDSIHPVPLLHPFLPPASWNADAMVPTLVTILDHEGEGHTRGTKNSEMRLVPEDTVEHLDFLPQDFDVREKWTISFKLLTLCFCFWQPILREAVYPTY